MERLKQFFRDMRTSGSGGPGRGPPSWRTGGCVDPAPSRTPARERWRPPRLVGSFTLPPPGPHWSQFRREMDGRLREAHCDSWWLHRAVGGVEWGLALASRLISFGRCNPHHGDCMLRGRRQWRAPGRPGRGAGPRYSAVALRLPNATAIEHSSAWCSDSLPLPPNYLLLHTFNFATIRTHGIESVFSHGLRQPL